MRKLIAFALILTMLCCIFGCGKKEEETSAPAADYSTEDLLLSQAAVLAQYLGEAADSSYPEYIGITNAATQQAKLFRAASYVTNISSGAFLPLDGMDLPSIIHQFNASFCNTNQLACTSLLQFSTQFYSPKEIPGNTAIFLRYGEQFHIVVFFEPQENQLVKATLYPLFPKAGQALMTKYFPNAKTVSISEIHNALSRTSKVSYEATPTGNDTNPSYYLALAKTILADTKAVSNDVLEQYTSDSAVISQAAMFINALAGDPVSGGVYRFPADATADLPNLSSKYVQHLANQKLYLGYTNHFSAAYGSNCMAANAIVQNVITTCNPGTAAKESEAPVLVALNYGNVTVLVTLYPNEYHTYQYSVTCLPCNFTQATSLLAQRGAMPIR